MTNNIPRKVKHAFDSLIAMYGDSVHFLGERGGIEYYIFDFPDDVETGFPQIVSYHAGEIHDVEGFDAVRLAASFRSED